MPDRILPSFGYAVRSSQAALQYGVGAMVNFREMTLMTGDSSAWNPGAVRHIHDERLERRLGVSYFGQPDGNTSSAHGLAYARFPEWFSCPGCKRLMPIAEWLNNRLSVCNDRGVAKPLYCPFCRHRKLVPSRFITICAHGHIDDFPWVEWVHGRNIGGRCDRCANPQLSLTDLQTGSSGLDSVQVRCSCGAHATLAGAFDENVMGQLRVRCTSRHPWRFSGQYDGGECNQPRITQLRGASSVYFPVTTSSLSIPPYSSRLSDLIIAQESFQDILHSVKLLREMYPERPALDVVNEVLKLRLDTLVASIQAAAGYDVNRDDIKDIVLRRLVPEEVDDSEAYARREEYDVLSGRVQVVGDDSSDFRRVQTETDLQPVKQVSLIKKLREVQALLGFSRKRPSFAGAEGFVNIRNYNQDWLPGYEVRGEGIFIELDNDAIEAWYWKYKAKIDALVLGDRGFQARYNASLAGQSRPRTVTAKFILLHTLSHLLLKQMSFECGYGIASLKERIYCSDEKDGNMAGILIYTASGDSEGTLGGLVRQGQKARLTAIFRKAVESAIYCSNDPVCSLSHGQGLSSLNNAACYSCALVPETSCPEERNTLLDRSFLVGTVEDRSFGFFSPQLFGNVRWERESEEVHSEQHDPVPEVVSEVKAWVVGGIRYRSVTDAERNDIQNGSRCLVRGPNGTFNAIWVRPGTDRTRIFAIRER